MRFPPKLWNVPDCQGPHNTVKKASLYCKELQPHCDYTACVTDSKIRAKQSRFSFYSTPNSKVLFTEIDLVLCGLQRHCMVNKLQVYKCPNTVDEEIIVLHSEHALLKKNHTEILPILQITDFMTVVLLVSLLQVLIFCVILIS